MFLIDLAIDIISVLIFMLPVMILLPKYMKKQKVIVRTPHKAGMILYIILIASIFSINGIPSLFHMKIELDYNYIPFQEFLIYYPSYLKSGITFIFFGLMLPIFWNDNRSFKNTFFYGFCFSLFIEIVQIFCSKSSDVNDLIFSMIGLLAGYALFSILHYANENMFENTYLIFRNRMRTSFLIRYEFILYIVAIFLFMFCFQSIISNLAWRLIYTVVLLQ